MAAKWRKSPGLFIWQMGILRLLAFSFQDYNLNNASFWPKYIHIAINPTNITREKKNGGLCSNRIEKSVTNKLVKKGWSSKALRIFLKIAIQSVMSALSSMWKKGRCIFNVAQHAAKCLLKSTWRFYYIQKIYVKENPSTDWV